MEPIERYRGSLLGLAAGDALGTTLEFSAPGSFAPIDDMVSGGPLRLKPGQWTDDTSWDEDPLAPRVAKIASGSFRRREPPEIRGTSYVVRSLEAMLWSFDRSSSFREGTLWAVNQGDDADTTGAVYGQLAGAYHGEREIPEAWRERLAFRDLIASFAGRICTLATLRDPSRGSAAPIAEEKSQQPRGYFRSP